MPSTNLGEAVVLILADDPAAAGAEEAGRILDRCRAAEPETTIVAAPAAAAVELVAGPDHDLLDRDRRSVWRTRIEGGVPERVTQFKGERVPVLRWSPDGRLLACIRHVRFDDVVLDEHALTRLAAADTILLTQPARDRTFHERGVDDG